MGTTPPPDYKSRRPQSPQYELRDQQGYMRPPQQPQGYMGPPQHPQQPQGHMGPLQHPQQMMMHPPQMHQQQNTTVIVNQQPTATNDRIIGSKDGHRDWNSGLFSCFDDVGKCMWAWCCPECVLADISARLGECAFVTCCVPGGLATVRTRVRTLGGIRGSICKDYMAVECCYFCAMCQIQRELEYMGL